LRNRGIGESPWLRWALVVACLVIVLLMLVLPLVVVLAQAFQAGVAGYAEAITSDDALSAIRLTLLVAGIAVPLNTVFGLAAGWCLTRYRFAGRTLLLSLTALPFSVSPVVSGLVWVLLFGLQGWFGPWLKAHDVQIIFALPGIILATLFVTVPYVARQLIPLMQAQGVEEELAALTLGASGWQIFRRITLPRVRWGLLNGVLLCNARAMGEFGAVSVVSGHIAGLTNTMPLDIEILYNSYNLPAAFAVASLLAGMAVVTLVAKGAMERRQMAML
jgi:sulfate transport system permease protein